LNRRNCFNGKFGKEKTCCEAKEFKALLTRKVFVPFSHKVLQMISESSEISAWKNALKVHDKVD